MNRMKPLPLPHAIEVGKVKKGKTIFASFFSWGRRSSNKFYILQK